MGRNVLEHKMGSGSVYECYNSKIVFEKSLTESVYPSASERTAGSKDESLSQRQSCLRLILPVKCRTGDSANPSEFPSHRGGRRPVSLGSRSAGGHATDTGCLPWPMLGIHKDLASSRSELQQRSSGATRPTWDPDGTCWEKGHASLGSMTNVGA